MHIAQQMPLPLTISCSSKSRLVLTFLVLPFWYLLTRVVHSRRAVKRLCVCVPAVVELEACDMAIIFFCDFVCLCVCMCMCSVCMCVCIALKGKQFELSTPKLVHVKSMAAASHAKKMTAKGQQQSRSHGYENMKSHICQLCGKYIAAMVTVVNM